MTHTLPSDISKFSLRAPPSASQHSSTLPKLSKPPLPRHTYMLTSSRPHNRFVNRAVFKPTHRRPLTPFYISREQHRYYAYVHLKQFGTRYFANTLRWPLALSSASFLRPFGSTSYSSIPSTNLKRNRRLVQTQEVETRDGYIHTGTRDGHIIIHKGLPRGQANCKS